MFRILAVLALMPSVAAADWSPRPTMFNYDATFDLCTADPSIPDLAATCADAVNAAYVLKRAVALAFYKCHPENIATCTRPFTDDDPTIPDLYLRNITECEVDKFLPWGDLFSRQAVECVSNRNAALWADIAQQTEQENQWAN